MSNNNNGNTGLKIISFLFPIIGWVLYFVKKDENIEEAKAYSKCAWLGFGISFFIGFFSAF
ncbi:MAG: hypothetical protein MJZ97_11930 [Bacteroidales bacterium]|nr:hypothetical protein [Bacteroidales bacterium]